MNSHMTSLEFTLTLVAPFLSKGTGAMRFGLDSFRVNANGKLVISGLQSKGVLRHQLDEFIALLEQDNNPASKAKSQETAAHLRALIDKWFGQQTQDSLDSQAQARGLLDFPWQLVEQDHQHKVSARGIRTRIRKSNITHTVEKGALFVSDTHYAPGTHITFKGTSSVKEFSAELVLWLNKAAHCIRAVGAQKSVGHGQIAQFSITAHSPRDIKQSTLHFQGKQTFWPFTLTTDRPLCMAKPHPKNSNMFVSEDYIAGNVIKAGIAQSPIYQALAKDHPLKAHFDALRVVHAHPQPTGVSSRPKSLPLSLALFDITTQNESQEKSKTQLAVDLIKHETPVCFKHNNQLISGAFISDWKSYPQKQVLSHFSASDITPHRSLTVHTAVDRTTRSSKSGMLYSFESVEPYYLDANNKATPLVWRSQISLSGVALEKADSTKIADALNKILSFGLYHIGKTKAHLTLFDNATDKSNYRNPLRNIKPNEAFVIKLESDALMFTDDALRQHLTTQQNLRPLYAAYFGQFTEGGVPLFELVNCFVAQKLAGGDYLHHRFDKPNKRPYAPQHLTTAGSVFLLRVNKRLDAKAVKRVRGTLNSLLQQGLPLPSSFKGYNWRQTPFLPQNGFGEITLMAADKIEFGAQELVKHNVETIALSELEAAV